MGIVPQRELRNDIGDVLRRAESGEEIVVTVSGRPVAQLGPLPRAQAVDASHVRRTLAALPRTSGLLDDIREGGGGFVDPWA